ncbi:hypothetical protein N0V90_012965 [Kalmusia sp. IMI 367209]|nr:hypothetical protein N0V90_012965 [Kalmusia sp. IMI 367209]
MRVTSFVAPLTFALAASALDISIDAPDLGGVKSAIESQVGQIESAVGAIPSSVIAQVSSVLGSVPTSLQGEFSSLIGNGNLAGVSSLINSAIPSSERGVLSSFVNQLPTELGLGNGASATSGAGSATGSGGQAANTGSGDSGAMGASTTFGNTAALMAVNDPLGLNSGFAAPNPALANWKPPADNVPKSSILKDPRFTAENSGRWSSPRQRAGSRGSDAGLSGTSSHKDKAYIELEAGVSWPQPPPRLTGPPRETLEKKEPEVTPLTSANVESTVTNISKRVTEVVLGNSYAAYPAENVHTVSQPIKLSDMAFIPPHLRKKASAISQVENEIQPHVEPHPIMVSSGPGENFTMPTISKSAGEKPASRRPSSATLVSSQDMPWTTDEYMAQELQMQEAGVDELDFSNKMVQEVLWTCQANKESGIKNQNTNRAIPQSVARGDDLYDQLQKTHELLWKQEQIRTVETDVPKDMLLKMDEDEFQAYYNRITELHLFLWSQKKDRIQQIITIQKALENICFNLDDLFEMNEYELTSTLDKISSDYKTFLGRAKPSQLMEKDICGSGNEYNDKYFNNNGATIRSDSEYDIDGCDYDDDDDEDDDDDDDDSLFMFKGRS